MNKKIKILYTPQKIKYSLCILIVNFILIISVLILAKLIDNILFSFLCSALYATRLKCFNNIVHECFHKSFSGSLKFNELVGKVLCIFLLIDYYLYKKEHVSHHKYLGNYSKDMDFNIHESLCFERNISWKKIFIDILSLKFVYHYRARLSINNNFHKLGLCSWFLVIISLFFTRNYNVIFVILFGFMFFLPLIKYMIDIIDHGGLYNDTVDEIYKSRNFIINNFIVREIIFPRNDCYHLIHHLYPFLPVHSFQAAHEILLKDHKYKELKHHWNMTGFNSYVSKGNV